jgi:hypothetical protein
MPYRYDPRPVFDARMAIHVALIMILAWLGAVLILPARSFATTPAWRLFARIGSEEAWAVMFLLAAGFGALGVTTPLRSLKAASVWVLATVHGALAVLFFLGNPTGGASGTFAIIALLGYYLVARLRPF